MRDPSPWSNRPTVEMRAATMKQANAIQELDNTSGKKMSHVPDAVVPEARPTIPGMCSSSGFGRLLAINQIPIRAKHSMVNAQYLSWAIRYLRNAMQ